MLTLVDAAAGACVQVPPGLLGLQSGISLDRPSDFVERFADRLGIRAAVLRLQPTGGAELEMLPGQDRPKLADRRWTDWEPDPPLAARPDWQKPGWYVGATALVDEALARMGRRRSGPPRQPHDLPFDAVLEIPTERGSVWFKALPPIFGHEPAVVARLAGIAPRRVPEVLASGPSWWIARAFAREEGGAGADAYAELAELQLASTALVGALGSEGCPLLDLNALVDRAADLPERADLLADAAVRSGVAAQLGRLRSACEEIVSLSFPRCLVHGDFYPGNRRWTRHGWLFYDWTDSLISWPFLDLANGYRFEREFAVGRSAFARVWKRVAGSLAVERALALSEMVGAAHQAASYMRIADGMAPAAKDEALNDLDYWARRFSASAARVR
jgi:hypothetical protein